MAAPCPRCRKPACDYSRQRCTIASCELRSASVMNALADRAAYLPRRADVESAPVHVTEVSHVAA